MHAEAEHPQRSGKQFGGAAALAPVARHPVHAAVPAKLQPSLKAGFGFREVDSGHSGLLKAEFVRQRREPGGKVQVVGGRLHGEKKYRVPSFSG